MFVKAFTVVVLLFITHHSVGVGDPLADDQTPAVLNGDEKAAELDAARRGAIYIPLRPSFVANFGGPGRLKYLKADIAVRLENEQAANSVRHHMPYIRNNLILLFSAQTDESVDSQEGKEALRQEALREVREVIKAEDGLDGVLDLYFNGFIVQK